MNKLLLISAIMTIGLSGCVMECEHCKRKSDDAPVASKQVMTDSAITGAIKGKYLADPNINALNIHVTTRNGVVTLTGNVANVAMKKLAISIAEDTEGVERVISTKLRTVK